MLPIILVIYFKINNIYILYIYIVCQQLPIVTNSYQCSIIYIFKTIKEKNIFQSTFSMTSSRQMDRQQCLWWLLGLPLPHRATGLGRQRGGLSCHRAIHQKTMGKSMVLGYVKCYHLVNIQKAMENHHLQWIYPLVNIQKAIKNGDLQWIYPLKTVIFHSYVSLPEGIQNVHKIVRI